MKTPSITERIEAKAFEVLNSHPEGVRWSELNLKIEESDRSLHPKTINGTVWKLTQKYPDRISKKDGLFRLL